ncbi:MAG: hypothetical protein IPG29_16700 [Sphingobacteriales bacterium]|nr:hypothetical protein [Sphingobacteriales bacterium]
MKSQFLFTLYAFLTLSCAVILLNACNTKNNPDKNKPAGDTLKTNVDTAKQQSLLAADSTAKITPTTDTSSLQQKPSRTDTATTKNQPTKSENTQQSGNKKTASAQGSANNADKIRANPQVLTGMEEEIKKRNKDVLLQVETADMPDDIKAGAGCKASLKIIEPDGCTKYTHTEVKKISDKHFALYVHGSKPKGDIQCIQMIKEKEVTVKIPATKKGAYKIDIYSQKDLMKTFQLVVK